MVAVEDRFGEVVACLVAVELHEHAPAVGLVVDVGEQEEALGDLLPTSAMALASSEVREPACKAHTKSEALTVLSLREPATRRTFLRLSRIRPVLMRLRREMPFKGP